MLSDKALSKFDQQLLIMRIIHAALAMGVLAFAIFAVVTAGAELIPPAEPIDWIMAGFGALTAIAGWIVPRLLPTASAPVSGRDEADEVAAIVGGLQTSMIVSCAIFEGGAFANLAWYYTEHVWLNLAVAGVLWLFLLLQFPRRSAILDQVEAQLRRNLEEKELAGASWKS